MCCNSKGCCKVGMCTVSIVAKILVVVGGINWGLIGVGMLLGKVESWNLVNMLLGSMPTLEAIVYVLVGVAAVMKLFCCKCKKCTEGACSGGSCAVEGKMEEKM